ncbi:hypothetical protein H109_01275 [Trichophyton interdigitale MR816]|uniref:Uncharacterized protein n=1 Tax=Trichophyton interdigitale (strain MR816) TaxID=1215338 RepID=A0A059JGD4_TRIIM|nr:hypothetical protein H101_06510 [Trichophyton interdigitale H6]KDB26930.1 hypothetical protein H109_01275 [Trichophyton interdigitale MR816]
MAAHLGVALCAVLILGLPLYQFSISNLLQDRTIGWASTLTYYVVYPVVLFSNIAISILSFVTAPLIELSSHILYISLLPWHLSTKLEPLYKFFGVAAVIGIATGWALFLSSSYICLLLNLSPRTEAEADPKRLPKRRPSWDDEAPVKSEWATQFANASDSIDDSSWRRSQPGPSGLRSRRLIGANTAPS